MRLGGKLFQPFSRFLKLAAGTGLAARGVPSALVHDREQFVGIHWAGIAYLDAGHRARSRAEVQRTI